MAYFFFSGLPTRRGSAWELTEAELDRLEELTAAGCDEE
jgi:hypothetical protein